VSDLAPILQGFFTDRLARQKKASPHTVAAYRDTCKLLLIFAQQRTGKAPSSLSLADLDAALIGAFLQHLEDNRGNGSATRNARLAAIRSLFSYAAPKMPEHAATISQVLAIPPRRRERAIVSYLTPDETDALLAAPTGQPGTAAATTPCSWSPSRPACGYPSSPASPARTSTSAPDRMSAATARAARTGQHR
jgi:integrase/recombinase XerD